MKYQKARHWALLIGALWFTGSAMANDSLDEASQAFCQHMKQCTLKTMDAENIDPNMRQMVDSMVKGMCKKMTQRFELAEEQGYEDIREGAAACMRSMTEQDCDALEAGNSTPACREYEAMVEQYNERGDG